MNRQIFVLLAGAALCGGLGRAARAQTTADLASPRVAPAVAPKKMHPIGIKNVPPSLIAYWLDPQNNPLPKQFRASKDSPFAAEKYIAPTQPQAQRTSKQINSAFALPLGIDRIVAIDPQKLLLVFGTDAGVTELADTIAFLDKPLRQIEIEAQFVTISSEDVGAFGIQISKPDAIKESVQIGFVRGNFQAMLSNLVMQNKAKIITAPRVVAYNNFQAEMNTMQPLPGVLGLQDEAGHFTQLSDGLDLVSRNLRFSVTPTINNDETVTVLMSTASTTKMLSGPNELILEDRGSGLESIANVRDGETIALVGLAPRFFSNIKAGATTPAPKMIVFVTARIVRRAEDDLAEDDLAEDDLKTVGLKQ